MPTNWLRFVVRYKRNGVRIAGFAVPTGSVGKILIENKVFQHGVGWVDVAGVRAINLYEPPDIKLGDPAGAARWVELVKHVYPDPADHNHIFDFCAYTVQHPETKINHGLILGGNFGIGKDTLVDPVDYAVGRHNATAIRPSRIMEPWTGHMQKVLLVITELHDTGEATREELYERMKEMLTVPPMGFQINKKYIQQYNIPNVVKIVGTTNHLEGGIYVPAGDRRLWIGWSELPESDQPPDFWTDFHVNYLHVNGYADIAAWLHARDVSHFEPGAPPPMNDAKRRAINAGKYPDDLQMQDVVELLDGKATTIPMVATLADRLKYLGLRDMLLNPKQNKVAVARLAKVGYTSVDNPDAPSKGNWKVKGVGRMMIYAPRTLYLGTRVELARKLAADGEPAGTLHEPPERM